MSAAVEAQWPVAGKVRAFTTVRHGMGSSLPPFDHFNLGNRYAADGDDPQAVLEGLAQGLANKFLHHPSQALTRAPEGEREQLVRAIEALYPELDPGEAERE